MSIKDRFIVKASVGFALGVIIDIAIAVIYLLTDSHYMMDTGMYDKAELLRFLLSIVLSGVLGFVGNGGAVIYEIESWSILKCTVVHFILAMSTFFIVGSFNRWITPGLNRFNVTLTGIVVFVYVIIWMVNYLTYKKEIRQINHGIAILKRGAK